MTLSFTEQLAYSTVRLTVNYEDGKIGWGTAFFFSLEDERKGTVPLLVTNKHVIEKEGEGKPIRGVTGGFRVTTADAIVNPNGHHVEVTLDRFHDRWHKHRDPAIDLVAMPVAQLFNDMAADSLLPFYRCIPREMIPTEAELAELTAVEDVLMVGYPNSMWDETNNAPIFRNGITATHPAKLYNGRPEFMIDAACFPGSSGSPVFLYNVGSYVNREGGVHIGSRIKFLGVLWGGPQYTPDGSLEPASIPTVSGLVAWQRVPLNLGYVVRASEVLAVSAEIVPGVAAARPTG